MSNFYSFAALSFNYRSIC